MIGQTTQRFIALSAVLMLSVGIINVQQNLKTTEVQSATASQPDGLQQQGESAIKHRTAPLQLAQAPCNPEKEVCNK